MQKVLAEMEESLLSHFVYLFQDGNLVILALHCAAAEGNVAGLQELIGLSSVNINATNKVCIICQHI